MSPAQAATGNDSAALFRFGFICFRATEAPEGDRTWSGIARRWKRLEVGGFVIHHDPEAPLRQALAGSSAAVLIGDAFVQPGPDAVEDVLSDLLAAPGDDRFLDRLDELSGRFALLVLDGSTQRVFHDPIGSRSLFYRASGEFCVGSHAQLVASAFSISRSPVAERIVDTEEYASRSVKYLPGDLTMYEGVNALAPNNFYDIRARRAVRYWPRARRRPAGFDELFGALDAHLGALAAYLRGRYLPVLGVTGGVDTRLLIAAFRAHGVGFEGVTWLGRKGAYFDQRELALIDSLIDAAGIEHAYLKLGAIGEPLREVAAVARRNVGGYRKRSTITAHMHQRFAGRRAVFVRGYGAEIMRGFYNLRNPSARAPRLDPLRDLLRRWALRVPPLAARMRRGPITAMTISELTRAYNSSMRKPRSGEEHTRLARAAFEGFVRRANYDRRLERFGYDLNDIFYWEHRMGMWGSAMHNEMDPALLSIAGFNSRAVYEAAFAIEPGKRLTRELFLDAIRRYDPDLARIPYF